MNTFHKNLKQTLKDKNITQKELSDKIGVKPQSIWVWLNETYPPMDRFLQICEVLEITPNDVLCPNKRKDAQNLER